MENKKLIIKNTYGSDAKDSIQWHQETGAAELISKIDIGNYDRANFSSMVSGIPTIFARAHMFKSAMSEMDSSETEGIIGYYNDLIKEWKGFIACLALGSEFIRVREIRLTYSGGKRYPEDAKNIYEPTGAFGNMLFDENRPKWCKSGLPDNHADKDVPFIYVVLYNGQVVGATSPDSLLFTGTSYSIIDDNKVYLDNKTHRFTDPLANIDAASSNAQDILYKLYAYVNNIVTSGLDKFVECFDNSVSIDKSLYAKVLERWLLEIKETATKKGWREIEKEAVAPEVGCFPKNSPFAKVFNFQQLLYGKDGQVFNEEKEGSIKFFSSELLLDDSEEKSDIARICIPECEKDMTLAKVKNNFPMFVLPAKYKDEDRYAFFALPLSAKGLNVLGANTIQSMLYSNDNANRLEAKYIPKNENDPADKLEVTLSIVIQGTQSSIRKTVMYRVRNEKKIEGSEIKLWPNFVSHYWNRYFLYSELPHNLTDGRKYRATPIIVDTKTGERGAVPILTDREEKPVLIAKEGVISIDSAIKEEKGLEAKLLISTNRSLDRQFQYEIYESNMPFRGLYLTTADGKKVGGYLLLHFDNAKDSTLPQNILAGRTMPTGVTVGVDFGSTNTSVAYFKSGDRQARGLTLKNLTLSLLSIDQSIKPSMRVSPSRLFFFQAVEKQSNSIKSMLTLHDEVRIDNIAERDNMKELEVSGGIPCFETNLVATRITEQLIYARGVNDQDVINIVHNMKWDDSKEGKANREAYLRTLLLHIYAQLFDEGVMYPEKINWSYPSAMPKSLRISYSTLWGKVATGLSPICDDSYKRLELKMSSFQSRDGAMSLGETSMAESLMGGSSSPISVDGSSSLMDMSSAGSMASGSLTSSNDVKQSNDNEQNGADIPLEDSPLDFSEKNVEKVNSAANGVMTEALAVANYLAGNVNLGKTVDDLILCFDIGGSTSDISAIAYINDKITLVKQSSIRFAAQQVSGAASLVASQLKPVLINACKDSPIYGLSENFAEDTAAYYFDKVMDLLSDDEQKLQTLYKSIAAECPVLMSVNLYVTGLIMFYAGMLTRKIVNLVRNSRNCNDQGKDWKPRVQVVFAGKGSRIFDWLAAVDLNYARQYYFTLLAESCRDNIISSVDIKIGDYNRENVKYEVSMGLVYSKDIYMIKGDNPVEIIGEDGFCIKNNGELKEVNFEKGITPLMIKNIGSGKFRYKNRDITPPKFTLFANFYRQQIQNLLGVSISDFENDLKSLNVEAFIKEEPEFTFALRNGDSFDFVAPIIIMEGKRFYQTVLMQNKLKR